MSNSNTLADIKVTQVNENASETRTVNAFDLLRSGTRKFFKDAGNLSTKASKKFKNKPHLNNRFIAEVGVDETTTNSTTLKTTKASIQRKHLKQYVKQQHPAINKNMEEVLKNFDLDRTFGACMNISRKCRYKRAIRYNLCPRHQLQPVADILNDIADDSPYNFSILDGH